MKEPMSFDKFRYIMDVIIDFGKKRDRFSNFIEEEISTSTYCIVDFGSEVENTLVNLLADQFNCWYAFTETPKEFDWWRSEPGKYAGYENDIEAWLYCISEEPKTVTVNGVVKNIDSLESFYEFLVEQYNEKLNLTET